jgi:hypothetical protein
MRTEQYTLRKSNDLGMPPPDIQNKPNSNNDSPLTQFPAPCSFGGGAFLFHTHVLGTDLTG